MMSSAGDFSFFFMSAFVLFVLVALGVLLVLWIALPFSVFGIKDLVREAIDEQKRTNEILESILKEVSEPRTVEGERAGEEKAD